MMPITSGFASANCLLKTLEEPPPSAMLILIGTSPSRQLPTIRSRSQVVRFRGLDVETVANILIESGAVADRQLADASGRAERRKCRAGTTIGRPGAVEFSRSVVVGAWPASPIDSVRLARAVQAFVDEAGKESSQRRERLRVVIGFAVEFYRSKLRTDRATWSRSRRVGRMFGAPWNKSIAMQIWGWLFSTGVRN